MVGGSTCGGTREIRTDATDATNPANPTKTMMTPPFDYHAAHVTALDVAEKYLIEEVKREVSERVKKVLLEEIGDQIQEAINTALAEITFNLRCEKDILTQIENIHVLVEWIKCREEKREYRTKRIIEEVTCP